MHVVINKIKKQTLQEFAEQHNLTLVVNERNVVNPRSRMRYYASFQNCEIKEGSMLISCSGDGATPDAAIRRYTNLISNRTVVYRATLDGRKDIMVPTLIYAREKK